MPVSRGLSRLSPGAKNIASRPDRTARHQHSPRKANDRGPPAAYHHVEEDIAMPSWRASPRVAVFFTTLQETPMRDDFPIADTLMSRAAGRSTVSRVQKAEHHFQCQSSEYHPDAEIRQSPAADAQRR